jgi:hypothetical protein
MLKQINDGIINTKYIVKIYFKDDYTLVISDINNHEMQLHFEKPINDRKYFLDLFTLELEDPDTDEIDMESILEEL